MAISLNTVNSEVVRAHKRIDSIGSGTRTGFPNYTARTKISVNYVATSNGYIEIISRITAGPHVKVSINNVEVFFFERSNSYWHMTRNICIPIAKGDKLTACSGPDTIYFVPVYWHRYYRITALENKAASAGKFYTKWSGNLLNSSRYAGTRYTNNTGHAIFISYQSNNYPSNGQIHWYVNGVLIGASNGFGGPGGGFFMVPAGATYQINNNGSTIATWYETIG